MDFFKRNKSSIIGFIITLVVSLAAVYFFYTYQKDYHGTAIKDTYAMLSNAFFAVGVIFLGFGALILISMAGTFIGVKYVFKQAAQMYAQFFLGRFKKIDYIAFKAEEEAKIDAKSKRAGKWNALIVGAINLAISLIFLRLYYSI
ncbi:MAG: DUF3899 domain-containing protein [Lachnospiraceae bacterium]|jgi:hypothetical protein|nr:DUF3899 domain-containing protein [Lachnospiraceae bacterium]